MPFCDFPPFPAGLISINSLVALAFSPKPIYLNSMYILLELLIHLCFVSCSRHTAINIHIVICTVVFDQVIYCIQNEYFTVVVYWTI